MAAPASPASNALAPLEADAVVVGAGPAGLFQVFELGLLEINAHVIDSLPYLGGQCIELYPDKPIYDIPAVPACTGRELVARLQQQIAPFKASFHLGQEVSVVQTRNDGRFLVETRAGTRLATKTIFVAGGAGSFQPRQLKIEGLDKYLGTQLFYHLQRPGQFAGQDVLVVGGSDTALEHALALSADGPGRARRVVLLHRRDVFQAHPDTIAAVRARCSSGQMEFLAGQITGIEESEGRLAGVAVTGPDAVTRRHPLDHLLVFLGLSPKLGPIADWGLALERKQVVVDTARFETSTPGIYAIGDINTYPGKKKLILSGFHEATLAAFAAAERVFPEQRTQLQYTTTSTRLHQLLGVQGVPADPG